MESKQAGRQILCFLLAGLFIFLSSPVWGKEIPVTLTADEVEYLQDGKTAIARGNVDIRGEDIRLTAEKVTFWVEKEELLAEGNVVLYGQNDVIRGRKIRYDFREKKGELIDARTYYDPWFAAGKRIERIGEKDIKIRRGSITTCDLENPHYRISAKKIDIYLESKKVVARHCVFMVGKIPIFYFPYYERSFEDKRSRITLVPGHESEWGTYLLGKYNFDLTRVIYGTAHLDFREKKGLAGGLDLKYHTKKRRGFWQGYYLREKDKETGTKSDRWRAEVAHREQLNKNTVGTFEIHRFSDINFRKDYFYKDYVKNTQPQTYLSLTGTYPRWNWNLLAKARVNDFYSVTERLPEIGLNLLNQKIWETPFYYKGYYQAAYLNKKIANGSSSSDTARVDAYNQVSYPVKLFNWLNLNPYLGIRETGYSKDINGDGAWRSIFYSGAEASTKIFRIFDVENERLDIHQLRHLIRPKVEYEYRTKPTVKPGELIQFDSVDSIDRLNFVNLELKNKLQTKRMLEGRMKNVDLLTFTLQSGFHVRKPAAEKRWKDIRAKLELRPKSWLSLDLDSYIDPYDNRLEMMNTDVTFYGEDNVWELTLGNRYERVDNNDFYSGLKWKVTPKWTVDIYGRYDSNDKQFAEQRCKVYRDLHCWMSSFTYVKKRNETELWLALWIKAFPESPLSFSHAVGEDT